MTVTATPIGSSSASESIPVAYVPLWRRIRPTARLRCNQFGLVRRFSVTHFVMASNRVAPDHLRVLKRGRPVRRRRGTRGLQFSAMDGLPSIPVVNFTGMYEEDAASSYQWFHLAVRERLVRASGDARNTSPSVARPVTILSSFAAYRGSCATRGARTRVEEASRCHRSRSRWRRRDRRFSDWRDGAGRGRQTVAPVSVRRRRNDGDELPDSRRHYPERRCSRSLRRAVACVRDRPGWR
jgi:hypothetical protein